MVLKGGSPGLAVIHKEVRTQQVIPHPVWLWRALKVLEPFLNTSVSPDETEAPGSQRGWWMQGLARAFPSILLRRRAAHSADGPCWPETQHQLTEQPGNYQLSAWLTCYLVRVGLLSGWSDSHVSLQRSSPLGFCPGLRKP